MIIPVAGARYDQLRKKSSTLRSRLGWQPDTLESEIYEFDDKCYHIEDDFEVATQRKGREEIPESRSFDNKKWCEKLLAQPSKITKN